LLNRQQKSLNSCWLSFFGKHLLLLLLSHIWRCQSAPPPANCCIILVLFLFCILNSATFFVLRY
jgi:hypothetical protein